MASQSAKLNALKPTIPMKQKCKINAGKVTSDSSAQMLLC